MSPSPAPPNLLFLTDSLGEPRLEPEPVLADQVWPRLVARALPGAFEYHAFTRNGLDTAKIRARLRIQLSAYQPAVVVMQVGIVDCSPRALTRDERTVIARLPGPARQTMLGFVRRCYDRLIAWRDIAYVPPEAFADHLSAIRDHFGAARFVVVPIGPANLAYQARNPLIARNVMRYNTILGQVFGPTLAAETYAGIDPERLYQSDNHHLSLFGHETVAAAVVKRLQRQPPASM